MEVQCKSVKIGDQVWMAENLNVSTFRNGDPIPHAKTDKEWEKAGDNKQPAWCYYENDPENGRKYGKLYNWHAVNDPRGLAPKGWHIPTEEEFEALKAAMNNDGNALKSVGEGDGDGAGTNTSGFSALLAGGRYGDGNFGGLGFGTDFWSSTEYGSSSAGYLLLYYGDSGINLDLDTKDYGFSVRCLKDN